LKIPFVAAGGIGDASGFVGAMGMGADAIMMGTAFMATDECPLGKGAKEKIVRSNPLDPRLRHQVLAPPDPEAYRKVMEMRKGVPFDQWLRMLERVNLKYTSWQNDADPSGEYSFDEEWGEDGPSRIVSLAVGVLEKVIPVRDLVGTMVRGAEEILDKMALIRTV
jgi:hypothetical protein